MVCVRTDLTYHLFHPPAVGRDTFHQTRLLKAPSNLALNTAREGAATASLGSQCQGLTTLTVKNFFLISSLSYAYKSLCSLMKVRNNLMGTQGLQDVMAELRRVCSSPSSSGEPGGGEGSSS